MVLIEADKSERWKSTHCLICGKAMKNTEPRYRTRAELLHGGRVVTGWTCEPCAKAAMIQQGAEQLKAGVTGA